MFCCSSFLFSYVLYTNIISCSLFSARCALYILYVCGMALLMPRFSAALPHGFSACGVFCRFCAFSRCRTFSSVLPPFSPAVLHFVAADRYCRGLCCFCFFAVRYFCRNRGRILRRQTAAVAKDCFRGFPKGRLLARKRWSFAARKDTFCTLKGHLLESGFSAPRALPHGSRRGRAEPCLDRGTRRA